MVVGRDDDEPDSMKGSKERKKEREEREREIWTTDKEGRECV